MGCFSFMCKKSGKPALSTSFDGSPVRLFLLKDGKVIEEMYGNYDSYGRVFKPKEEREQGEQSFEWRMGWGDVCDLMLHPDQSNGIALILDKNFVEGEIPTTRSADDPNQGWGGGEDDYDEDEEAEFLLGDCSDDKFPYVENPYHKVY